jgi:hypothetical protein
MEVRVRLHAPAALPQGKSPWYPLDRRLGGPHSRYGRGGEEKNFRPPPGNEPYNPDHQARKFHLCIEENCFALKSSGWKRVTRVSILQREKYVNVIDSSNIFII